MLSILDDSGDQGPFASLDELRRRANAGAELTDVSSLSGPAAVILTLLCLVGFCFVPLSSVLLLLLVIFCSALLRTQ